MKYCQSCGKILKEENSAREEDGSPAEYCTACYEKGHFIRDLTCDEMQNLVRESLKTKKIPTFVKNRIIETIPNLRRWQNESTGD